MTTATERIYHRIYDDIIALRLAPGARLSEVEIAKRFSVSRQPVRDAFFRLSQMGLLLVRPQRPTRVTAISECAIREAAFVRIALETACLRRIHAARPKIDAAPLHAHCREQAAAVAAGEAMAFHRLDDAFHLLLCRLAGREHVWRLIENQKADMDRVRVFSLGDGLDAAFADHQSLTDAIAADDQEASLSILTAHLSRIDRQIETLKHARPDCFAASPITEAPPPTPRSQP